MYVNIFNERKPIIKYPIQAQYSVPYKGSTLFFSQDATFLIKLYQSVRTFVLTDAGIQRLSLRKEDERNKKKMPRLLRN